MHDTPSSVPNYFTEDSQHLPSVSRSRLIRLQEVLERVPLSRTSIYNWINAGTFPRPIKIGPRSVAWLESAVDEWIANKVNQGRCGPDTNTFNPTIKRIENEK